MPVASGRRVPPWHFLRPQPVKGSHLPNTVIEFTSPSFFKGHNLLFIIFCVLFKADPSRDIFFFFLGRLISDDTIRLYFTVTFRPLVRSSPAWPQALESRLPVIPPAARSLLNWSCGQRAVHPFTGPRRQAHVPGHTHSAITPSCPEKCRLQICCFRT